MKRSFKTLCYKLVLMACLLCTCWPAIAQSGKDDPAFNPDFGPGSKGQVVSIAKSLLLPDGKILIATGAGLSRLNADGSIDPTFSSNLPANNILPYSNGDFIVITAQHEVYKMKSDFTVDSSFHIAKADGPNGGIWSADILPDGKIIIGGLFTTVDEFNRMRIARLNVDGTVDITFNPGAGPDWVVWGLSALSDGKMMLGGSFSSYDGEATSHLIRINSDGTLDKTFSANVGDGYVSNIVELPDSKIMVSGSYLIYNDSPLHRKITRLNADGTLDATFTAGAIYEGTVNCFDRTEDGKFYVGFTLNPPWGNIPGLKNIVRLNSDGSVDTSFKPYAGFDGGIYSVLALPDGRVLTGGDFYSVNGTSRPGIAMLNADGSVVGAQGADNTIYSTAAYPNGKLLIGGDFKGYNGKGRSRLARVNEDGTLDTTFDPETGADNSVLAAAIQQDEKSVIGGKFVTYNGTSVGRIARLDANGTLDATFNPGTGADGNVTGITIQSDGKIMLSGEFTAINGITRSKIARLLTTGSLDTSFDPGASADGAISSCAVQADGKVLIVGSFQNYDGTARTRIARLNADGTLDTSFDPGTGFDATVTTVRILPDGKILVAGVFSHYNGVEKNRIARLNADGSVDSTFDPGEGVNDIIRAVAIQADNKIVIGGDFESRLARLNSDGSLDEAFFPDTSPNNSVLNITTVGENIFVTGSFTTYDGEIRGRIAKVLASGMRDQFITFDSIPSRFVDEGSFAITGSASSGLPVTYVVADENIVTVEDGMIHIVGVGTTTIEATQAGDSRYNSATSVTRTVTITKRPQKVYFSFDGFEDISYPLTISFAAYADSGLPVTYSLAETPAASLEGNALHIVNNGTIIVTATQAGNEVWESASTSDTLIVEGIVVTQIEGLLLNTPTVYPNPTTGNIVIKLQNKTEGDVIMNMYNSQGRIVYRGNERVNERGEIRVDMTERPKSLYFIHIDTGKEKLMTKVIRN